ncbi:MmpS family transport accessory protein [Micromonospora sp. NPDC092111]|uniref:MmpS family transport accessory protein n=1 Tax=Micromonospora sp. NPDC092111 TaxID=3364289 RepID=UPI00382B7D06
MSDPSATGEQPTPAGGSGTPTPDQSAAAPSSTPAWTPPDPLAVPQPWAPPDPWATGPWDGTAPAAPPGAAPAGPPTVPAGPAPAAPPGAAPAGPPTVPAGPPGHPTTFPGATFDGPATGWPPPGYPPPFAHPGYPARGGQTSTGTGRVVGIVVAVVAVLAVGLCGCLGVGGLLLGRYAPEPVAEEPYGDPFDDGYPEAEPEPSWSPPQPYQPSAPATKPSGGPGRYPVTYEVTGTGPVDIQYYDGDGYFIQQDRVRLPWRMKIRTDDPNRVLVTARRTAGNDGAFRCTTTLAGRPPVTRVAGEDFWLVECHGRPIR